MSHFKRFLLLNVSKTMLLKCFSLFPSSSHEPHANLVTSILFLRQCMTMYAPTHRKCPAEFYFNVSRIKAQLTLTQMCLAVVPSIS